MPPIPPSEQNQKAAPPTPPEKTKGEGVAGVSFIKEKQAESIEEETPQAKDVRDQLQQSGITTTADRALAGAVVKKAKSILRPLRTYRDDVANVLKTTKGSKISIQAAEADREKKRLAEAQEIARQEKIGQARAQQLGTQKAELDKQERAALTQRVAEEALDRQQTETARLRNERETLEAQQKGTSPYGKRQQELIAEQKIRDEQKRIQTEQQQLQQAREARRHAADQAPLPSQTTEPKPKRLLTLLLSILFFTLGGGVLYGAYSFFFSEIETGPEIMLNTLILAEDSVSLDITGLQGSRLVQELTETKNTLGTSFGFISYFALQEQFINNATDEIFLDNVAAPVFLESLAIGAPSSLSRSFDEQFMLGLYVSEQKEMFLILKPNFYENAFAGMLAWESSMLRDLSPLFETEKQSADIGTTTSQTRVTNTFGDKVIDNQDTRILYDENGNILLLYSFISRDTLIITSGQASFREVINRLSSKKVSR